MEFLQAANLSPLLIFLAGLLSFLSPCVLPLIPLYFGYLAGGAQTTDEEGVVHYERKTVMLHTVFFIIGISAAFFLLGAAFTALGQLLFDYKTWLVRIGAIIVIVFGVWMLFPAEAGSSKERRFKMPQFKSMNPLVAFAMGFLFSFAWTPCVGPMLTGALVMAASAQTAAYGFLLIGLYTLGFVIPFLLLGLFTTQLLNLLKKHRNVFRWTNIIGGVLLIVIGISMLTGWMNSMTSQLSRFTGASGIIEQPVSQPDNAEEGENDGAQDQKPSEQPAEQPSADQPSDDGETNKEVSNEEDSSEQPDVDPKHPPAPDFTLTDQNGNTVSLSDYQGKVIFLNFWATWCPPCQKEMPDVQQLYEDYGENSGDVIVLGVANPSTPELKNSDGTQEEVEQFLTDRDLTFPVVMDTTGETLRDYRISSFPTTYVINKDGTIEGYIPGAVSGQMMKRAVEQALAND